MNEYGYNRLTAGTIVLTLVVLSVLIYQVFAFRGDGQTPGPIVAASSIQLFPQSMPVLADSPYLLVVTDQDGHEAELGSFYHRVENLIEDQSGNVIHDGVFALPANISIVDSVQLFVYDGIDLKNPRWLPFLQGRIQNDRTVMTFRVVDLLNASGKYLLASPTDGNNLINERSGLWFGEIYRNQSSLTLPVLPSGWIYEGWAVVDGQTITTGRFKSAVGRDDFSGFSDTKSALPGFPGEDFLLNAPVRVFPNLSFPVDLANQSVMITIEPDHNGVDPSGQGPFPTAFLMAEVPRFAEAGRSYDLELSLDALPKATVVLR